jgi:quercetin dioxygenase-like cupin family protein
LKVIASTIAALCIAVVLPLAADDTAPVARSADSTATPSTVTIRSLPDSAVSYVSLLKPPVSRRLRSGYVTLVPGAAGEEHSTEDYEEVILILAGSAELHYESSVSMVHAAKLAYVPPHTTHFLRSLPAETLRYVYVVTRVE